MRPAAVWHRCFSRHESHPPSRCPAGGDSRAPAAALPATDRRQEAWRFAGDACCFSGSSAAVVSAGAARRLLARLGDVPDPLVVVGYHFTQDATKVLQDAGATLFAVSSFWWSDARWRAIRQR